MRALDAMEVSQRQCKICADVGQVKPGERIFMVDENGRYKKSTILTCPYDVCPYHELDTEESKKAWYSQFNKALTKKLLGSLGKEDGNENK